MYDDTEASSRGEVLPYGSWRPLPAKPTEKNKNVEDEYESISEKSSYERIPLPSKREEPNAQAKQSSPDINSVTAESAHTPAIWKGSWRRNSIPVLLVLIVGCLVIDIILLSQHAVMISELRKLNSSSTKETCEVSTAFLITKELKSALLEGLRTLENYTDQMREASDIKVEKEIFRLEKKLSAVEDVCSRHDFWHWHELEGSYYYFSDIEEEWEIARKVCAVANSHLLVINSRMEQDFVVPKIKQETVWLGLNDREVEKTWRWVDGSPVGQTYWKHGEPNNSGNGEDCAVLRKEGNWNDIPCDTKVHFVCERGGCVLHEERKQ